MLLILASEAAGSEGVWLAVYAIVGEGIPNTLPLNDTSSHLLSLYYQSPYHLSPDF